MSEGAVHEGSVRKKKFYESFYSMSALQVVNYVLPLVTFPYLVRVLGPERFGLLAFAQGIMQYFMIVTDYGFGLTGPRDIAVSKGSKTAVDELFSKIIFSKLILLGVSFVVLAVIILSQARFREECLFYFLMFGIVIDNVFFPGWFFQGMEEMKFVAIRNILIKILFTLLIFVLIKTSDDYIYIPIINFMGYVCAAVTSFIWISRKYAISLLWPGFQGIIKCLKEGFSVFTARGAIALVTTANFSALGLMKSHEEVGYYAVADRIVITFLWIATPAFQAFYPYITQIHKVDKTKAIRLIKKFLVLVFSGYAIVYLLGNFFISPTVDLCFGGKYENSIPFFRVLSLQFLLAPAIYVISNIVFMVYKLEQNMSSVFVIAGVVNVACLAIMLAFFKVDAIWIAGLTVVMQICILFVFLMILKDKFKKGSLC